jgi:O-acetyl-ADP-ribose deacetylase (regulator of RNase III)
MPDDRSARAPAGGPGTADVGGPGTADVGGPGADVGGLTAAPASAALSRIHVVEGSIVELDADAIVNAANSSLMGGGGVDGAIHRAAGPELAREAGRLAPCPAGEARITAGHRLRARHVIHTVGPVWRGGSSGEPEILARCYRSSLALAEAAGVETLAIPAISTGIYGYPSPAAAAMAVGEIAAWLETHDRPSSVVLSAFSADSAAVLRRALADAAAAGPTAIAAAGD